MLYVILISVTRQERIHLVAGRVSSASHPDHQHRHHDPLQHGRLHHQGCRDQQGWKENMFLRRENTSID